MIYAIDIDGILTLDVDGHDYENRKPNLDNINKLSKLKINNIIILFTSRDIVDRTITINWLNKWKVPFDDIIFNKPKYDLLIDDKALNSFDFITN